MRRVRSEYNVPPSQAIDAFVVAADSAQRTLEGEATLLMRLTKTALTAVERAPAGPAANVILSGGTELIVPLEGLIDVAKESAVVCVRMPPAAGRKHRTSHLQTVPATVPAITQLAAELKAAGVQMVSMEATSDCRTSHAGRSPMAGKQSLARHWR